MSNPEFTRNTNVRQFPPCTPVENERTKTTTTTRLTSSSTSGARARVYARTREADPEHTPEINVAVDGIRDLFSEIMGYPMNAYTERFLRADLAAGTPYVYYSYAIQETAFAPRPSWRYTLAIVKRLVAQNVSEEDLYLILQLRC